MKHLLRLLFLGISILSTAYAQQSKEIFFENGPQGTVRFFYDKDYYLVPKDCEFKFIERVAAFDVTGNKFNGIFKDFDPSGRTILSGTYVDGKKEGEFTAFYPDGTLKWKILFINNQPNGDVQYFYPDGKPMLFLSVYNQKTFINQFWDRKGNQTIKDGEGKINITLPILGFTEHGFTKFNTAGNVSNGTPEGLWYTVFINDSKSKEQKIPFMVSLYENGLLRNREIDENFEDMLLDFSSFSFIPRDSFPIAELLQSKKCSFDEHTGFNSFIADKFKDFLEKRKYSSDTDISTAISYKVRVSKNGSVYAPTITESSRELTQKEKSLFTNMITQVYYYLPSYLNNKPIDDRLTISLIIDTNGEIVTIPPVQIVREKGF